MDMTSSSAAVMIVLAAFGALLAMAAVNINAMRGAGERPCEGRARREEAARIARAAEILENESVVVSHETVVAIVAQRKPQPGSVRT
jgi:hypothetical protein